MKTLLEWFDLLTPEDRTKAIHECIKAHDKYYLEFTEADSFYEALNKAFDWAETENGFNYWAKISRKKHLNS